MEIYFNLVDHVLFEIIITGRISVLLVIFWFNLQQRVVRLRQLKLIKVAKLLTLRLKGKTITSKWKIGLVFISLNKSMNLSPTHLINTKTFDNKYKRSTTNFHNKSSLPLEHWSCPFWHFRILGYIAYREDRKNVSESQTLQ